MDNQHKKISGYRDLNQDELDFINRLKNLEATVGETLKELDKLAAHSAVTARWAAVARTHLETGFMFAIKVVARPDNGLGYKT